MTDAIKPPFKQITPDDLMKLDVSEYYAEHKYDGMLIYATIHESCKLFSDRFVDNTSKYPHIAEQLKGVPKGTILVGEIYIQNGNVFDVNTKTNYSKARYCVFDIITFKGENVKDKMIEDRQELVKSLFMYFGFAQSEVINLPEMGYIPDMWARVEANKWEGLVLKPKRSKYGVGWLKCKRLEEIKIRILAFDPKEGKKGAFILDGGNRCDALTPRYVQQFQDIQARGKTAMAECEYAFLTKDGKLFQPRLRQLLEVD